VRITVNAELLEYHELASTDHLSAGFVGKVWRAHGALTDIERFSQERQRPSSRFSSLGWPEVT
jgi:hypothetical protein